MSSDRQKMRRLSRLEMVRAAALRAAEARLSSASALARAADARRALVHELISANGMESGLASHAMLRGAASLRQLLQTALTDATARAEEGGRARDAAAQAFAQAQGRKDRTASDLATARARAEADAEERERADQTPAKRKVMP